MEYITTKEASAKWGISTTRITILANEGRIPGAQRLGRSWLIPAAAVKPHALKAGRSGSDRSETDNFSFPLYHFRPDWSAAKKSQLSEQQQSLLLAETAVLECRFKDAWPILSSILNAPEDIATEIGCLWNACICCITLKKPEDFSRIFLRLQIILSEDFPHREDCLIILDYIKTYVDTIDYTANNYTPNTDAHDQSLPLTYVLTGYVQMLRESINPGTANADFLKLGIRFLKTTGSVIAVEMMHIYLTAIYYIRHNMEEAEKQAEAAVQIAYENRLYFPLVAYYRFFPRVLFPILARYPKDFQEHCQRLSSQYDENYAAFLSYLTENSIYSKLDNTDFPYAFGVLMGLSNAGIAGKLGVSVHTVKRRISKICEKTGVTSKKKLADYLHDHM